MSVTSDIIDIIRRHDRFLISTHIRSDGDAIGSEIGLWEVMRALGKQAQIVNDGAVPRVFQCLDPGGAIAPDPAAAWPDAQAAFVLDATSLERIGGVADRIPSAAAVVNIDHHVSNGNFGSVNHVDPDASSTGELIFRLIREASFPAPLPALEALYAAIITDTGRFTHGNTSPEAFEAAADLLRGGVDAGKMGSLLFRSEPVGLTMLRAKAGSTLELFEDGQVAVMTLTREMFQETGVDPVDTQEFADLPRSLDGVEVGVLFRELEEPGKVKASFRSRGRVDVNAVAGLFDGGGHVRASGCTVDGGMEGGKAKVVQAVLDALRRS